MTIPPPTPQLINFVECYISTIFQWPKVKMKTSQSDAALFPKGFYDIGGQTFEWVFKNREDFVSFTIHEMLKPTHIIVTPTRNHYSQIDTHQYRVYRFRKRQEVPPSEIQVPHMPYQTFRIHKSEISNQQFCALKFSN